YLAVQSWLLSIAQHENLILLFEDLHWADPSTLELLGHLVEQAPTAHLLLLLTCRPEFTPPWSGRSHVATIMLSRLPRVQWETMVQNNVERASGPRSEEGGTLARLGLPLQILDQIIAKTDGVPLFVEELTKMVLESDLLRERQGHYELTGPL